MKGSQLVKIKAPAKINLGLEIIKKREDGYHIIETFFQAIDLYDELSFTPAEFGIHLTSNKKELETGKENIIWKAATELLGFVNHNKGVKIHLNKQIPIGAGLGGGSSDAAATLRGLIQLYRISISQEDIDKIAAFLGADVPFFLNGPAAFAHGTGEILEECLKPVPFWVVIVKPGFSISTKWAYKEYNSRLTKSVNKIKILRLALESSDTQRIGKALFNDLESLCFVKYPILAEIKKKLLSYGACGALMSGSGSSVFGLFSKSKMALEAWKTLNMSSPKGEKVFLCKTINS